METLFEVMKVFANWAKHLRTETAIVLAVSLFCFIATFLSFAFKDQFIPALSVFGGIALLAIGYEKFCDWKSERLVARGPRVAAARTCSLSPPHVDPPVSVLRLLPCQGEL